MVKLMGHVAIGLLMSLPAWIVWEGRLRLGFIGLVLSTVKLPDIDLLLDDVFPGIHHHGVTHTIVFVALVAVGVGFLVAAGFRELLERWWYASEDTRSTEATARKFVMGSLFLGGLSHILGDMLSAPDIAQPVEPLWPLLNKPISLDVIYYSSTWWNLGLLLVAILAYLAMAAYYGVSIEPCDAVPEGRSRS